MDEVFQKLSRSVITEVKFGNFKFALSNTLLCVWIAMALLIIASLLLAKKLNLRPGKAQVILEMLVAFIRGICQDFIGDTHYKKYVNYRWSISQSRCLFACVSSEML